MGKVSTYAYVDAKLKGKIGLTRDSHLIDDMIKAPTLNEAVALLANTKRHATLASVYEATGDIQMVELELFKEMIADYRAVAKELPERQRAFVAVLEEKLEIENLKSALRMWYSEAIRHHSIRYRSAYLYNSRIVNDIDWQAIINAQSFDRVKEAVRNSPYSSVLEQYSYEKILSAGLFDVEIELDQLYYRALFEAVKKLNKSDRAEAEEIYLVDVDLKNLLNVIRFGYYHEVGKEELKRVLLPFGYLYMRIESDRVLESDEAILKIRAILKRKYPEVANEISEIRSARDDVSTRDQNAHEILEIESYLSKTREKEYRSLLVKDPFSIGIVLAYFFIANHEDALIRAVLSAKMYKWSEERIREAIR